MRILLIGNFALPYEEENLHNLTLLNLLKKEGNICRVINISPTPSKEKGFINIRNYPDFIFKLVRYGLKMDVIHFLTKGYTRPGLMKLMTTVILSKLLFAKSVITLHSEMFSVFGRLRSKMGGQQLLRLSFFLTDKIICGDKHTCEIAMTHFKRKEKFVIIPSFIYLPDELKESELLFLRPLENKKRVIFFSDMKYPSLLFETLNTLLGKYLTQDTDVMISFYKESSRLRPLVEGRGTNILFIDPEEKRLLTMAYAKADFVLRAPGCDGKTLFEDIAFVLKRTALLGSYLYFPLSLIFIKEGEVSDLCAYIFNNILAEKAEVSPVPLSEDFFKMIKDVYSQARR